MINNYISDYRILFLLKVIVLTSFTSCDKSELRWKLEKSNPFDINENSACFNLNGESMNNVTSKVEKSSPSSPDSWSIGNGYKGRGFTISGYSLGGEISFNFTSTFNSKMTFWTKSINAGYSNIEPDVLIDGNNIKTYTIDGDASSADWMQLETSLINSGTHNVTIKFPRTSTYYSYYIDEIQIWCSK